MPAPLEKESRVVFGLSTRTYVLELDYGDVQKTFEAEKKNLEKDLRLLEKIENEEIDLDTLKETLGMTKRDTIYVGNLPYSITEKDVAEFFGQFGNPLSIRIPEDFQTKMKKGYAFITFDSEAGAKKALQSDGIKYYERRLKISIAEKKPEIEEKRLKGNEEEKRDRRERASGRDRDKYEKEARKDFQRQRDKQRKRKRRRSRSRERESRQEPKKRVEAEPEAAPAGKRSSSSSASSSSSGGSSSSSSERSSNKSSSLSSERKKRAD